MERIFGLLGLAAKAGKIVSGEFMTEKALKEGRACLVLVAEDASQNTKKHFRDMSDYRSVPIRLFGTKEQLGRCIGKEFRASLALTDSGFANSLLKKMDANNN